MARRQQWKPHAMRAIWSWASPPLRMIIGGLMDGSSQIEIAAEMRTDRFKVARRIKSLAA